MTGTGGRRLTAGESHGPALVATPEGLPAAGIVAEARVAMVPAGAVNETSGDDRVGEISRNVQGYLGHPADR